MNAQGQSGVRGQSGLVGKYGPGGNMGEAGDKGDKGLRGLVVGTASSFTDNVAYGEIYIYLVYFNVLWILKGEAGTNGSPGPNGAVGLPVS